MDSSELDVATPIELDEVHDERLDVELVVAIRELRNEENFAVVAFGTAMSRSHDLPAPRRSPRWFDLIIALSLFARCKCGASTPDADAAPTWLEAGADVNVARSADLEELWTRAKDGDDDELARLAEREGERGLEERAAMGAFRITALRAMAFSPAFSALPTLGAAAEQGTDDEARAAVTSADAIAARKRAQVDAEDDEELAKGCASLLAAAKNATRAREIRVGAVRALRMISDGRAHCVKASDIPSAVDAIPAAK